MSTCTVDQIRIHYQWHPGTNGKAVAFLNGVMASVSSWDFYTQILRRSGYGVLLHDFRGQLLSDKPEGPYTFSLHASDLAALMDFLSIETIHLVGTSYGGEVGMQFAADFPERTNSLCVIDSVTETDPLLDAFIQSWRLLAWPDKALEFYWSAVPALYGGGFIARHMQMLKERASVFSGLQEDYFFGQRALYDTFQAIEMTGELYRITCPSLIICGTDDILKPPKFSRIIAEKIKSARLVLVPDCGHVAIFEQPETLAGLISGFLATLE